MAKLPKQPKDHRGVGRPSLYTPEMAKLICDRLASGESLRTICGDEDMPHRTTIDRWQDQDPDFASKCARAREAQADVMFDKIMDVADNCTPETAQADRVKIAALQWGAEKLKPKVYGAHTQVDVSGTIDHRVSAMTDEEREERAQLIARKALKLIDQ